MKVGFVGIGSSVLAPLPAKNRRANTTIENNVFNTSLSAFGRLTNFIDKIMGFLGMGSEISCDIDSEYPAISIRVMV
jgi:hypothetical protein